MMNKALVLCSGGPDGVVAAAIMKSEGFNVTLLHFSYGQQAWKMEATAAMRCAAEMRCEIIVRTITGVFLDGASSILRTKSARGDALSGSPAFVPARNLILASIAVGIAEVEKYGYVAIGNIKGGAYPDNQPAFVAGLDALLVHCVSPGLVVRAVAPVNDLTKAQVIRTGYALKAPVEQTWSCYTEGPLHCGKCASCLGRKKAYAEIEMKDPTVYAK